MYSLVLTSLQLEKLVRLVGNHTEGDDPQLTHVYNKLVELYKRDGKDHSQTKPGKLSRYMDDDGDWPVLKFED